jgi:hypothetical protein
VTGFTTTTGTLTSTSWTYHADVWARAPTPMPSMRVAAAMTYDDADGYVLLFGGVDFSYAISALNDTWTYAHGHWTRLRTPVAPAPRYGAAMAYDATDGYVLLFGGASAVQTTYFNDTWSFVGGKWSLIRTSAAPDGSYAATMAYNGVDGYVLLFGGDGNYAGSMNDTWAYVGGVWTELMFNNCYIFCPADPEARELADLVYDASDGYVVLFGGLNDTTGVLFSDTWIFYGGSWYNVTSYAGTPPPARFGASATYDAWDGYVLLYGGTNGYYSVLGDTWNFTGGTWSQMSPASSPGAEANSAMAYDATDAEVVYLPGLSGTGPSPQTWLY